MYKMFANKQMSETNKLDTLLSKKGAKTIRFLKEMDVLISQSSNIPLTAKVAVDAENLINLMESFKETFPKDILDADMILSDVQDIVEQAELKAEDIISVAERKSDEMIFNAQQQAENILNESRLLHEAQQRANAILADAEAVRLNIINEASGYVSQLFSSAENGLSVALESIRNSKNSL